MDAERLTIPLVLDRHTSAIPHQPFVVSEDETLTYAGLDRDSGAIAATLIGRGIGKGTRVGLLMPNGCDWARVAIGIMRIGGVLVPLSTLLPPRELAANLATAGVEHLVCVAQTRRRNHLDDLRAISPRLRPATEPLFDPALPRLRSVILWHGQPRPSGDARLVDGYARFVRPADDMVVIFTSGSRGQPKGVLHTQGGALGAVQSSLQPRCIDGDDRLYIPMPFFWMGGFGGGLLTVFVAGATLIIESEPTPESTLRLLARERVTLFRGWPDQAAALASHPAFANANLSTLKPGSLDAVLPPHQRGAPGARPVLFGMTETFGPYCADRLDRDLPPTKQGSLGRPFAGIAVRITDPDTGEPLPVGAAGEIQVRGPNVMRGLCRRTREQTFTRDCYYPTGDAGRLDDDGYLYFAGRLDDMFKVKGATVYPSEVEAALESFDYVQRAFVVDTGTGATTRVGAAVLPHSGASCTIADLERDAAAALSSFKVPSRWRIVSSLDDIPRSPTGKVDKDRLRAFVEEADSPEGEPSCDSPTK